MKENTLYNVSLKNYNTLKLGGSAKEMFFPEDYNELINKLKNLEKNSEKFFLLGGGSNLIISDEDFDGTIINLKNFKNLSIEKNILTVESGLSLGYINSKILNLGFTNFTWAIGIPGTLGGAIYGNAGAYNKDIFTDLISVTVIKENVKKILLKEEIKHSYRKTSFKDEIIIEATFRLTKSDVEDAKKEMFKNTEKRIKSQPLEYKNAGSTFKNPEGFSAGRLIDECNLKNFCINDACISEKHANFIINKKNASFNDVVNLIEYVKKEVKEKKNISLELENKIIKWDEL